MSNIEMSEKATKFSRWDGSDYLETEEDIALYFQYCQEDDTGNGSLVRAALIDIVKASYLNKLAVDANLSRQV